MSKYIDVEKFKKSIGNYMESAHAALNPIDGDADYYKGKIDACKDMQEIITFLQQEQPETSNNLVDVDAVREDFITEVYRVLDADPTNDRANAIIDAFDSLPTVYQDQPEVDLEKEITPSLVENMLCEFGVQSIGDMDSENLAEFARHFWNKGYNARKEE